MTDTISPPGFFCVYSWNRIMSSTGLLKSKREACGVFASGATTKVQQIGPSRAKVAFLQIPFKTNRNVNESRG